MFGCGRFAVVREPRLEAVEVRRQRVPLERGRPGAAALPAEVRDHHRDDDRAPRRPSGRATTARAAFWAERWAASATAISRLRPRSPCRTASLSTTPTTRPFSTAQIGRSLAAITGTALRTVVETSSVGPSDLARGGLAHDPAQRQHVAARDVAHEVRDVVVGRRADEVLRRPELHDAAVAHDRDPVAEAQRLGQVVGDEDHRLARLVLQADHLVLHVAADQRVERAERLVVEHHLRVDGEGAREPDALLHAAGELVRELVRGVLEPDELQHLGGAREPLRLRTCPGPRGRTRRCRSRCGARAARSAGRPSTTCDGAAAAARRGRPW